MTKHLDRDMNRLHKDMLSMCSVVEEMIDKAALALCQKRWDLADQVVDDDASVDQQEVAIEGECLKMLALHQPVAVDLRRIVTVVKVNNYLERIADLAVNTAERAKNVGDFPEFRIPDGVNLMVTQTTRMVGKALDAFVNLDNSAARDVVQMDDQVDQLNVRLIHELRDVMQQDSLLVAPALHCFSAIRHLERIADLSTNIADDVIFLVEGEIVRHRKMPAGTTKTG